MKCPICNSKIPFSLPMHMMIAHGPSEQLEQSEGPEKGDAVELSERSMNDMRVQQADKRHSRRHPHRKRRARR